MSEISVDKLKTKAREYFDAAEKAVRRFQAARPALFMVLVCFLLVLATGGVLHAASGAISNTWKSPKTVVTIENLHIVSPWTTPKEVVAGNWTEFTVNIQNPNIVGVVPYKNVSLRAVLSGEPVFTDIGEADLHWRSGGNWTSVSMSLVGDTLAGSFGNLTFESEDLKSIELRVRFWAPGEYLVELTALP